MSQLKGKVAIVIGASSGIGRAAAMTGVALLVDGGVSISRT